MAIAGYAHINITAAAVGPRPGLVSVTSALQTRDAYIIYRRGKIFGMAENIKKLMTRP